MKDSYAMLDRRRHSLLKKMAATGPFLMATVSQRDTKCGNPDCKCATDKGARHPTMRLSWTDAQGSGTCYVPKDLRQEVERWIQNYWQVKTYMTKMTELGRRMIRMYAKTLGRVKKQEKKRLARKQGE